MNLNLLFFGAVTKKYNCLSLDQNLKKKNQKFYYGRRLDNENVCGLLG